MIGALQRARVTLRGELWVRVLGVAIVLVIAIFMVPAIVSQGFAYFLRLLIIGLTTGAIYALIAIGYTMVYGIIELINFAHGDVFTLSTFIALPLLSAFGLQGGGTGLGLFLPLLAVTVIVMLISGTINVGIERFAYRPLRNAPRLAPLITAVGMSFVLEGVMFVWKGPNNLSFPALLPSVNYPLLAGVTINSQDLITMATAAVAVGALALFVNRSRLGKAMRATAQDREAAQLMGINIDRTIAASFFIGAALAAVGGITYGLYINSVEFQLGFEIGLIAFTAAVLGGIGNIPGAALGGLVIGIIRAMSDGYINVTWTDVVTFAVLILVLVIRPTGLLGMRVPEK